MTVRSSVVTELGSQIDTALGVTGRSSNGEPDPFRPSGYPYAVYTLGQPDGEFEVLTMGGSGVIQYSYDATMTIYLGEPDTTQTRAEAAQQQYADRLRFQLAGNYTLAGLVFDTTLYGDGDNIDTFKDASERPYIRYKLRLTEQRARNAAAS